MNRRTSLVLVVMTLAVLASWFPAPSDETALTVAAWTDTVLAVEGVFSD
ncbi:MULTISPECIES: hypothetical protein [unclassified Rhizobacter]|nr:MULTISPECIES: hypothetical protein [unclassified Rhizobacter]